MAGETLRIAATADLHVKKGDHGSLQEMFTKITESADVALLCGDLTDCGQTEEARILAKDITSWLHIPAIGVLGNHDFESGRQEDVVRILTDAGVTMLDGTAIEIRGVGFAGVKGFGGGFGPRSLGAWGEEIMKRFVHESIEEARKLEAALARLRTAQKAVVLHYAPIFATVEGEPPEIIPFVGSTRLEEPIDRHRVRTVFHGHAHHGTPEGRTKGNAAVYNVAAPLLRARFPEQLPFRVVRVPAAELIST